MRRPIANWADEMRYWLIFAAVVAISLSPFILLYISANLNHPVPQIPVYPAATGIQSQDQKDPWGSEKRVYRTVSYRTNASAAQVLDYYRQQLKQQGFSEYYEEYCDGFVLRHGGRLPDLRMSKLWAPEYGYGQATLFFAVRLSTGQGDGQLLVDASLQNGMIACDDLED